MFWLDGSSKLPFVPRCSYLMSNSRSRAFARSHGLIENQAQIVKSAVKIDDFDYWCICASELVDLVIDLVARDEKYLRRDGLSTREESLRRISDLNLKFINLVCFSTFERSFRRLHAKSRSVELAPDSRITTSLSSGDNTNHLSLTPVTAKRGSAVTIESPALPRHGTSRTTASSHTTTSPLVSPPTSSTRASAVPIEVPLPRHNPTPPRSAHPASTFASYRHEPRSTDRLASPTRVSKEGGRVESKDKERREEDEMMKEKGLEEKGIGRKETGKEVNRAGKASKPPPPSPSSNHERGQATGREPHKRQRRQRRHRYRGFTLANALVDASSPTNLSKHPPPFAPLSNEPRRVRRQRRSRRRHPHCVPANGVMSMSPHASIPALASLGPPIPPPSPGKRPPSRLPRLPAPIPTPNPCRQGVPHPTPTPIKHPGRSIPPWTSQLGCCKPLWTITMSRHRHARRRRPPTSKPFTSTSRCRASCRSHTCRCIYPIACSRSMMHFGHHLFLRGEG
jgi:hypothetical protein